MSQTETETTGAPNNGSLQSIQIVDDLFSAATYPGDDDQHAFGVRLQMPDAEATLTAMRWRTIEAQAREEGYDQAQVANLLYQVQCEDMAVRIQNEDGEPWNAPTVRKVAATSMSAWAWLRHELFPLAPLDGALSLPETDSELCSRLMTSILPWQEETAGSA